MSVSIIAAVAENGVIGRDGKLPWHLPEDLRHFRTLTTGHSIIMGRRTWQSLPRALPDRQNIVVTRQSAFAATATISASAGRIVCSPCVRRTCTPSLSGAGMS